MILLDRLTKPFGLQSAVDATSFSEHVLAARTREKMRLVLKILLLAWVVFVGPIPQAFAIPADELLNSLRPNADVNDFAGVLSPSERENLETRCRQLRERTGAELAVVTLKSLQGGQVDDFAVKLFKRWGIGQKDKKNGVLLLVVIADRKARIEVGYGIEPLIPDALAGQIIDRDLVPEFRKQHYAAGLQAAVNSICQRIETGVPAQQDRGGQEKKPSGLFGLVFFLAMFVGFGGLLVGAALALPQFGLAVVGLVFGGAGLLIGLVAAGALSLVLHVPAAVIGGILGWKMARGGIHGPGATSRYWSTMSSSPWTWGNYGGSSGGGWSSGGGGFSQGWGGFGGGSSGGGGASGSW
jgi:uncharacterized protein